MSGEGQSSRWARAQFTESSRGIVPSLSSRRYSCILYLQMSSRGELKGHIVKYKLSGSGEIKVAAIAHRAGYRIRIGIYSDTSPQPQQCHSEDYSVLVLVEQMSDMSLYR